MNKKTIFTIGYTLFQKDNIIDVDRLFETINSYGVNYLIDVRSIPYSKQFPHCNADFMKLAGKRHGIPYANMPEIGAKADKTMDVFSKASDIFFDDVFPIAKSNRPEKTELKPYEEIVDFGKFRHDDHFVDGLKRIEAAYDQDFTLCLMCSESKPIDCHRYFLISKALEKKYGEWLEVRHIVKNKIGDIVTMTNSELDRHLKDTILKKDIIKKMNITDQPMFGTSVLDNYYGNTQEEKINDFCDRYWNLMHGWKRNNNNESYD